MERLYWTVGPYNLFGILEAPDEEAISALALDGVASAQQEDR